MHLTPHAKSRPADGRAARESEAREPAVSEVQRLHQQGLALLEHAYSPTGAPVLGFFVYVAETMLMRSLKRRKRYHAIVPSLIGTPAILSARPGISQTELATYLGIERATAGKQVAACIERGWIRREVSGRDKRRFSLFITARGERMLQKIVSIIPQHEREFTSALTAEERETLKTLLRKLIIG
jgi:DNA-binding MarR family transcriptional regulator